MTKVTIDLKDIKAWLMPAVSEIAFFFLLYYIQYLLSLEQQVNIWASSALLWVLANVAMLWCPALSCRKKRSDHHERVI